MAAEAVKMPLGLSVTRFMSLEVPLPEWEVAGGLWNKSGYE